MNDNRQIYDAGRNGRNYQIKQIIALGYDLTNYENLVIKEGEENV